MDKIHIPNASQQLFLQGNDLFDTGRYTEAIAIAPTDWEARRNRGIALHDVGKYEEAIASHDQAIAHSNPGSKSDVS